MTMSKHRQKRGRVGEEGRFWLRQNLIEVVGGWAISRVGNLIFQSQKRSIRSKN